jgi:hypothetical protein
MLRLHTIGPAKDVHPSCPHHCYAKVAALCIVCVSCCVMLCGVCSRSDLTHLHAGAALLQPSGGQAHFCITDKGLVSPGG